MAVWNWKPRFSTTRAKKSIEFATSSGDKGPVSQPERGGIRKKAALWERIIGSL
jgi:hypothetical protein